MPVARPATGSRVLAEGPASRRIRCLTCERRCEVAPGGLGWCRTRRHQNGELVTLTYGAVSSLSCNPIEKKPLYHFYPGTLALTSGSYSCNLDCPWCQNYQLSKALPGTGRYMSPDDFVQETVNQRCLGTSISLNEPTLSLEWSLEVFELAHERGLYNTFVSNGYMTSRAMELLVKAGLDAINVDVKGDARAVKRYCGIDIEKVWRNCRHAAEAGVWLEITTLIIPGVNDQDEMLQSISGRIVADLGRDIPWHVSGYYPAYRFTAPPTPLHTLERAWRLGKEAGLRFVYLGNVAGHRLESTYCPDCEMLLIRRRGLGVTGYHLDDGHCPSCGRVIPGVWESPVS
ncbi:MAG TPA: AmmeMemoRadiSam system radical SAM enzyme [Anaerolineae bacterium]|nr:AmmeMemoRadiSam system radical SAM enzyme [Anaerolineae bacterium]